MDWVAELPQESRDELRAHLHRFGPPAFELYVILTLVIGLHGPIPAEKLAGNIEDYGDLDWHRIKGEFELRDGEWHIKRPTAAIESVRA
jgi:hypothetical protein